MNDLKQYGDFISADKLSINLPVPLGSTVYEINTKCSDSCTFQREVRAQCAEGTLSCNVYSPCHTIALPPKKCVFNMSNIEFILPDWNKLYFSTENEANAQTKALVESHITVMALLGFNLDSKGYSVVPEK